MFYASIKRTPGNVPGFFISDKKDSVAVVFPKSDQMF